jgi:dihydrolipoamide dehydrogenase
MPNAALGRAVVAGEIDGFSKVVAVDGHVVGVHIIGPHATELIGAATLAVAQHLPVAELAAVTLPHPTLSEGLAEAAALLLGAPRHLPPATSR